MNKRNRKNEATVLSINVVQPSINNQPEVVEQNENSTAVSFSYGFRPVYYLSRAFGLMPYSIVYDANGEIQKSQVKKFDVVWFVISICAYSFIAALVYWNMKLTHDPKVTSYILVLGDYVLSIVVITSGVYMIGMDMHNRFKFIGILKKLSIFEKEVSFKTQ